MSVTKTPGFDPTRYTDENGNVHVIEASMVGEWQFSDGPPGERGCSADYFNLHEGLRDFEGVPVIFYFDRETERPEDGWQFGVTLTTSTYADNARHAIEMALTQASTGDVCVTVYDDDGQVLLERDDLREIVAKRWGNA